MSAARRQGLRGGGGAAKVTSRECSAARSTAGGLPHGGTENARVQVGDLAAEVAADTFFVKCRCGRTHQIREKAVPCTYCRRDTWDHHAVCASCRPAETLEQHAETVVELVESESP